LISEQYISLLQKVLKKLLALEQIPDQLEQNMRSIETQRNLEESGKKSILPNKTFVGNLLENVQTKAVHLRLP